MNLTARHCFQCIILLHLKYARLLVLNSKVSKNRWLKPNACHISFDYYLQLPKQKSCEKSEFFIFFTWQSMKKFMGNSYVQLYFSSSVIKCKCDRVNLPCFHWCAWPRPIGLSQNRDLVKLKFTTSPATFPLKRPRAVRTKKKKLQPPRPLPPPPHVAPEEKQLRARADAAGWRRGHE